MHVAIVVYTIASVEKVFRTIGSLLLFKAGEMDRGHQCGIDHSLYLDLKIEIVDCSILETTSERAKTFYLFMTRIGEGYKLSPSRNYTTFPALTGLAHSSRAKYRYNESLLEITNLTVKIQKLAQHIIKLINITTFAYYMIC